MDYPHAHVGHHSHRRDDDDNETIYPPPPHVDQPCPPPSSYGGVYDNSPPPPHSPYDPQYSSHGDANPPPPSFGGAYNSAPPPPHSQYDSQYSSHGDGGSYGHAPPYGGGDPPEHHRFQPHMPGFIGSHFHHGGSEYEQAGSNHSYGADSANVGEMGLLENKPSSKFECKAGGDSYCVGIREGKLVLTHPEDSDPTQHWWKDERYSTKVKDKDGYPSFILVNKGTAQAVKHSLSCHPVELAPYHPEVLDESVLWTEGKNVGSGYRTIRTVSNVHLVMDAWNADKEHGGIHDGTVLALYETWKGDNQNQQWRIIRHCNSSFPAPASQSTCKLQTVAVVVERWQSW